MKITTEKSLRNFDFWSGAAETVKYLTDEELDQIESILEAEYPDGMDETELNDFFWFDDDTIAEWLGYSDFEELMHRNNEPEDEEPDALYTASILAIVCGPAMPSTVRSYLSWKSLIACSVLGPTLPVMLPE